MPCARHGNATANCAYLVIVARPLPCVCDSFWGYGVCLGCVHAVLRLRHWKRVPAFPNGRLARQRSFAQWQMQGTRIGRGCRFILMGSPSAWETACPAIATRHPTRTQGMRAHTTHRQTWHQSEAIRSQTDRAQQCARRLIRDICSRRRERRRHTTGRCQRPWQVATFGRGRPMAKS